MFIDMYLTGEVQPYKRGREQPRLKDMIMSEVLLAQLSFEERLEVRPKNG